MKLGIKTTDGVSKLKLKTADGISKAVPCACCGGCGNCSYVAVTGNLLNVLRNATSATCYGYEGFFAKYDDFFFVDWGFAFIQFDYATGCLIGYSLGTPEEYNQTGGSIELGDCVDLCNEYYGSGTCSPAPGIWINGIVFPAYYMYSSISGPMPPQPYFEFL